MSDRDALLAAILAQPDEDTPRLVYADWLDEHGEPERAEFIRIQHRLPGLSRRMAEAKRLIAREAELRKRLFEHLDKLPFAKITFRRGFVDSVTSGLGVFVKHAPELSTEDAPAFELVLDLDEIEDSIEDDEISSVFYRAVAARIELRRCVALKLPFLREREASEILASPNLTGLRRFDACGDFGGVFDAFDSPTFSNLRWLNVHDNPNLDHHPPNLERLVSSPHLANLEHLDLGRCDLHWDCLLALATTTQLRRLRYLDISCGWFGGALATFFQASSLPSLTELDLSDSFVLGGKTRLDPDEATRLLADSPLIERLTSLALRRNEITDEGVLALAASPRKLQLTHLDLWGNEISATAKQALEKRFGHSACTYDRPHDRRTS